MALEENQISLGRLKIPYNLFNLYFVLFSSILIVSMGQMYNQQRYIYFVMPLFVLVFAYMVYLFSFIIAWFLNFIAEKIRRKLGENGEEYGGRRLFVTKIIGVLTSLT